MVVAPGADADETIENLTAMQLYGPFATVKRGFTDFIKDLSIANKFFFERLRKNGRGGTAGQPRASPGRRSASGFRGITVDKRQLTWYK